MNINGKKNIFGDCVELAQKPNEKDIEQIVEILKSKVHMSAEKDGYAILPNSFAVIVKPFRCYGSAGNVPCEEHEADVWTVGYKVHAIESQAKTRKGMMVSELQQQVETLLKEKGFALQMESIRNTAGEDMLLYYLGALLATEPAELIDAVKKDKGTDAILEEAADTIIRAMNIFIVLDADAGHVIAQKMEKNMGRPFMYGHGEGK